MESIQLLGGNSTGFSSSGGVSNCSDRGQATGPEGWSHTGSGSPPNMVCSDSRNSQHLSQAPDSQLQDPDSQSEAPDNQLQEPDKQVVRNTEVKNASLSSQRVDSRNTGSPMPDNLQNVAGRGSGFHDLHSQASIQNSCSRPSPSSSVQLCSIPPLSATRASLTYPDISDIDHLNPDSQVEYDPGRYDPDQTMIKVPHSTVGDYKNPGSRPRHPTPEPHSVQDSMHGDDAVSLISLDLQSGVGSEHTGKSSFFSLFVGLSESHCDGNSYCVMATL